MKVEIGNRGKSIRVECGVIRDYGDEVWLLLDSVARVMVNDIPASWDIYRSECREYTVLDKKYIKSIVL